jgi:hypothetical protein
MLQPLLEVLQHGSSSGRKGAARSLATMANEPYVLQQLCKPGEGNAKRGQTHRLSVLFMKLGADSWQLTWLKVCCIFVMLLNLQTLQKWV